MLNDLLIIERSLRAAEIATTPLHKDIKSARRMPTVHILLKPEGEIAGARLVPAEIKLWTLRDGQKNSFPFVKRSRRRSGMRPHSFQRLLPDSLETTVQSDARHLKAPAALRRSRQRLGHGQTALSWRGSMNEQDSFAKVVRARASSRHSSASSRHHGCLDF